MDTAQLNAQQTQALALYSSPVDSVERATGEPSSPGRHAIIATLKSGLRVTVGQYGGIINEERPALMSLTPGELKIGDVVYVHGLKCVVTDAPRQTSHAGGETYATETLVINRADVPAGAVPMSFTQRPDGQHRWTIQGNGLYRVPVERAGRTQASR